jgi:hypothetical protein
MIQSKPRLIVTPYDINLNRRGNHKSYNSNYNYNIWFEKLAIFRNYCVFKTNIQFFRFIRFSWKDYFDFELFFIR